LNVAAASIAAPRPKSIPASRLSKHRTMSAPTSRKATTSKVRELQFFLIAQLPLADNFVCCGFSDIDRPLTHRRRRNIQRCLLLEWT
jgi:hypothetical protein